MAASSWQIRLIAKDTETRVQMGVKRLVRKVWAMKPFFFCERDIYTSLLSKHTDIIHKSRTGSLLLKGLCGGAMPASSATKAQIFTPLLDVDWLLFQVLTVKHFV